ncbi:hypothetical protein [Lichenihabitans sp. Uapishka_5]|nr:hypothetical protein [Lichenihabitans sp. Uapishka_5]
MLLIETRFIEALLGPRRHQGKQVDERAVRVSQQQRAVTPPNGC